MRAAYIEEIKKIAYKRPKKLTEPRVFCSGGYGRNEIMENQTKNTSFAEQTVVDSKQHQTFNPKATLLLNVLPTEAGKTTVEPMKKQTPATTLEESPEKSLQGLLLNRETSTERMPFAQRKWQLVSLLTGILFVTAAVIFVWLALEVSATRTQQGKLEAENRSICC